MANYHLNLMDFQTYVSVSKHYRLGHAPPNPLANGDAGRGEGCDTQGRQSAPMSQLPSTSGPQECLITRQGPLPTSITAHVPQNPGVTTELATQDQNRVRPEQIDAASYSGVPFFNRNQPVQSRTLPISKPDNITDSMWELLKDSRPIGTFFDTYTSVIGTRTFSGGDEDE